MTCVEAIQVDADSAGEWQPTVNKRRKINQWRNMADAVLVDAPCTGSGVLRRSPDAKWREFDMAHMTGLQANLMQQAATLVTSGRDAVLRDVRVRARTERGYCQRFSGNGNGAAV